MTDARFPERWLSDRRLLRLSDGHFRAYITALVWAVANRTDGVIEPDDLALIPKFATNAVQVFVDAGLWTPLDRGWLITDFISTQTSRAQLRQLDERRAKDREKKARQRAAKSTVTGDVPGDSRGDVPQDGLGQDRPGQDRPGEERADDLASVAVNGQRDPSSELPKWRGVGPDPYVEYK